MKHFSCCCPNILDYNSILAQGSSCSLIFQTVAVYGGKVKWGNEILIFFLKNNEQVLLKEKCIIPNWSKLTFLYKIWNHTSNCIVIVDWLFQDASVLEIVIVPQSNLKRPTRIVPCLNWNSEACCFISSMNVSN